MKRQKCKQLECQLRIIMPLTSCNSPWMIVFISWGLIGISVFPFAIWSTYRHIKFHQTNKSKNQSNLLYRLSIGIYTCTIISSISTAISNFSVCYISTTTWYSIWFIECICWAFQWFFLILLLFSRYPI